MKVMKVKLTNKKRETLMIHYHAQGVDHSDKGSCSLECEGQHRQRKQSILNLIFEITWISPNLSSGHHGHMLCISISLGF